MDFLKEKISSKKIATIYIMAIFLLVIDRLCKTIARLNLDEQPVDFNNWLSFELFINKNIAMGIPLMGNALKLIILLLILFLIIFGVKKNRANKKLSGTILITTGLYALSNLLDRFLYLGVIDYINIKNITVLNIADIMISVNILLLFFLLFNKQNINK